MSSWLGNFHDWTSKWDPLDHALVDGIWKSSTKLINETGRGIERGENAVGIDHGLGEYQKNLSQKDKNSFSRWGENTLGSAAAVYGGMAGAGAYGSGGAAGEAGAAGAGAGGVEGSIGGAGAAAGEGGGGLLGGASGSAPTAIGYGTEGTAGYTMPSGGSGLGYMEQGGGQIFGSGDGSVSWLNADGTGGQAGAVNGQGAQGAQGSQGMDWQNMMKQFMSNQKGGGSGGGQRSGRQNLPFMENEKSDQQKLAELLQALQQQDQGVA